MAEAISERDGFLYLTTVGWKSGKAHQIEIWYVWHDGRFYIVAEFGDKAHWVQNVLKQPAVTVKVEGRNFSAHARVVDRTIEPELNAVIGELMQHKYDWSDGLIVALAPAGQGSGMG